VWAARYLKMNGKRRLLGSFLHGSMANAMPQAIGAQFACHGIDRPLNVVSFGLAHLNVPLRELVLACGSI